MRQLPASRGVFDNTMAYVRWGQGAKSVLFVPGGPGNTLPEGPMRRVGGPLARPLVEAGYSVWAVTRPRNLPDGYSIEDMADDYAAVIATEFGGHVDIAMGSSMGGLIVQYLAANHPAAPTPSSWLARHVASRNGARRSPAGTRPLWPAGTAPSEV